MILWLKEITPPDHARVGSKALNLAKAARAGFSVPSGFCITTAAYTQFVTLHQLQPAMTALLSEPPQEALESARQLQDSIRTAPLSDQLAAEILSAYGRLGGEAGTEATVAVRSSATAEDLAVASFAGQQATRLNVRGDAALLQAVRDCWASLWSPRAVAYRARLGFTALPQIAVLVQTMVNAEAAGVAFSEDPISGEPIVVIEAAFGLGETVVSGQAGVDRYVADPDTGQEAQPPSVAVKWQQRIPAPQGGLQQVDLPAAKRAARVLSPEQVRQVAHTVTALARHFGGPQDVEWALAQDTLHVLQTRPITSGGSRFFTDIIPDDDYVWTSGFLNERFPRPVSPLGWSLIRELLDELAFRDPLRYLGCAGVEELHVTKLYRGHPYVNVFVFQSLYKVFPELLLPEDAYRYFPAGRTELRHDVPYPRSLLDPRLLVSMARHLFPQSAVWSPWHNYRTWASFTTRHHLVNEALCATYESLRLNAEPPERIWEAIAQAQDLNAELLSLHRWSLTLADLTYSLLRRLLRGWLGAEHGQLLATELVTGLPNKSLQMDFALGHVAELKDESQRAAALALFLAEFGHRSFHLDIYYPTFADDPSQVTRLARQMMERGIETPTDLRAGPKRALEKVESALGGRPLAALERGLLRQVVSLSQLYMPLREEQRFYWQKTLAVLRKLFLLMGQRMADAGVLSKADEVFFLSKPEIEAFALRQQCDDYATLAHDRWQAFERLQRAYDIAPSQAYPTFLRGNQPMSWPPRQGEVRFTGQAVSTGLGRGRVVVCFSPTEFHKVSPGDVLVTRSIDPAWTPVFGLLSALVLEHGGQLSHGAVVAREYGLPTVTGIQGITQSLHDGDTVLVDGVNGVVIKDDVDAI
jgi:phosphoenolpyruvate synthase/pyruvate phosphate dikinase